MQKAYDALKENQFGIEVYFGLEKDKPTFESSALPVPSNCDGKDLEEREDYIDRKKPDLSVRTFKGPFFKPDYPLHDSLLKFARKSCINEDVLRDSQFPVVDPQKHFQFGMDMWNKDNLKEKDGEDKDIKEGELVVVNGSGYYR